MYSICDGTVLRVAYQANGYGNYIIIKDDNSNYAFLFGHMYERSNKNEGDKIKVGDQFGIEGATGNVTGLHTHVEMQDYVKNGNKWINSARDPSLWGTVYLNATEYMGFPNKLGISVYYNGDYHPTPPPTPIKKRSHFPWILFRKKIL